MKLRSLYAKTANCKRFLSELIFIYVKVAKIGHYTIYEWSRAFAFLFRIQYFYHGEIMRENSLHG